jgi:nucleotide sugar dehydrogenase
MIFSQDVSIGLERISKKEINVCVVGVGTIGLPLATFLAKSGFHVTGLDISQKRVDIINEGKVVYEYTNILEELVAEKKLIATTDVEDALRNCEIIFVCVPTPLNKNNEMDIKNLVNVGERISPFLKSGMLLVFESSVALGTTSEVSKQIEKLTNLKFGKELGLSYCPERYNPTPQVKSSPDQEFNTFSKGITFPLDKISRVVGGIDDKSTSLTQCIYQQFITTSVTKLSSIEAAEATKLVENIFRDVNIALANEFAKVFPKFNLDVFEIIDAAKTKPFAFMPHYPGAGVGGECIPVDTWYLISQAEKLGIKTDLMRVARKINDSMPEHMIEILESELRKNKKELSNAKVSILGLCYKKNIPDIRLSPALEIISILKEKTVGFAVCDPLYEEQKTGIEIKFSSIENVFDDSDAILLITDHDLFKELDFEKIKNKMNIPLVIDGRNFFSKLKLDRLGFIYRAIGKPE